MRGVRALIWLATLGAIVMMFWPLVAEMLATSTSERQGRAIDRDAGSASMEKKKQEGYF